MSSLFRFLKVLGLIFLLSGLACPAIAASDTPAKNIPTDTTTRFTHPTDASPLAHAHVLAIAQGPQGFMWFGTELGGLCRYDGYDFKIYQHDPTNSRSLSHNLVVSLCVDRSGTMWIGCDGGGLNRYDRKTDSFVRYQLDPQKPDSFPHSSVWAIFQDHNGTLWLGGNRGLSRFDPKTGNCFTYQNDPNDPNSLAESYVRNICEDTNTGYLWVGTRHTGLDCFDPATGRFTHYQHDSSDLNSLKSDGIEDLQMDSAGNLWIATQRGLDRFNTRTKTFTHHIHENSSTSSLIASSILATYIDSQGRFWVGTTAGLDRYDSNTGKFVHYQHRLGDINSINDNSCSSIFEDNDGGVWFGTIAGGVNRMSPDGGKFMTWRHDPDLPGLVNDSSQYLYADRSGNLWIANARGINVFDGRQFLLYHNEPDDPASLSTDSVSAITEDASGTIWAAGGGFLNQFDGAHFKHYRINTLEAGAHARVNSMKGDDKGRVWLALEGIGLSCFDGTNFTSHPWEDGNPKSCPSRYIYPMVYEGKSGLWMGCSDNGLIHFDQDKNEFTTYLLDPEHPRMDTYNRVYSICEDGSGGLWIGANQGLLRFDPTTGKFTEHYTKADGLPANTIVTVRRDRLGRLWLATPVGLARFNPKTKSVHSYDEADGLLSNEFRRDTAAMLPNGEMFFAGPKGLIGFYPDQIRDNAKIPRVVLTGFSLFNKPVDVNAKDSPLPAAINMVDTITLKYSQAVFTFQFAALDYTAPSKNRYAYKLEGFDKEWRETDADKRLATYTRIPPGRYVFHVRGSNNDGLWNENGPMVNVIVLPAWWATWWFRLLAALAMAALIFGLIKLRVHQLEQSRLALELQVAERTHDLLQRTVELSRAKQEVEAANRTLEEKVNARTMELRETNTVLQQEIIERKRAEEHLRQSQKMEAFGQLAAGVAHDFNNILTIIQGNLSLIMGGELPKASQMAALKHTYGAAERAAGLTKQLLTFGRRQPFQPDHIDLNELVTNLAKMLRRLIGENISLETTHAEEGVCVYADRGMIEQTLINLAVNARDAMPAGGTLVLETRCISFSMEEIDTKSSRRPGDFICLSVYDTGEGIAPENLPHIFEPFFTTKEIGHGTGLGLATVFGIVEQHEGWIEVESHVNAGTAFHIYLPRSNQPVTRLDNDFESVPVRGGSETILLVEDEQPVREFMVNILTRHGYHVHEAASGVSACKVWQTHRDSIDLLITDMVMPEGLDGRQLADTLRSEKASLKIIYCSGYTDEVLGKNSLLRDKVNFLNKPFEHHKFLNAVRRCLDGVEPTVPTLTPDYSNGESQNGTSTNGASPDGEPAHQG